MKRLALMSSLLASPALAHGGAHVHPHGIDGAMAFLLLAVAVTGAVVAYIKVRK